MTRRDDGQILRNDLLHLLFDPGKILGGKTVIQIEIVIKPVFDGRSDGNLGLGEKAFYRLGHDVGGAVPQGFQAFRRNPKRSIPIPRLFPTGSARSQGDPENFAAMTFSFAPFPGRSFKTSRGKIPFGNAWVFPSLILISMFSMS